MQLIRRVFHSIRVHGGDDVEQSANEIDGNVWMVRWILRYRHVWNRMGGECDTARDLFLFQLLVDTLADSMASSVNTCDHWCTRLLLPA